MLDVEGDRRTHPRIQVDRPCKICDPRTGKYHAGITCDLSNNGLLIQIPRLMSLKPGDHLHVGVAMKRRQGLLQAKEMIAATVIRAMQTVQDQTLLAVKFTEEELEAPVATPLRIAA